jgi:hypothetical protein
MMNSPRSGGLRNYKESDLVRIENNTLILNATGAPAPSSRWERFQPPKGSSPFFGWIDAAGDPNTVRLESIVTVAKDQRTGRWGIILSGCGMIPTIDEQNAFRLMRRMGWTVEGRKDGSE